MRLYATVYDISDYITKPAPPALVCGGYRFSYRQNHQIVYPISNQREQNYSIILQYKV